MVAVPIAICACVVLLERSSERVVEDAYVEQMEGSVRLVAGHIRAQLDELAAGLRAVALTCGARESTAGGECAAELERMRRSEPSLFVSTMTFDRNGSLLVTTPPRVWREDERAVLDEARLRATTTDSEAILACSNPAGPARTVLVVASAGRAALSGFGAVGAAVDLEQMGRTLLESLTAEGRGIAYLAAVDGRLLLVSGWDRSHSAGSLREALGSNWSDALPNRAAGTDAGRWRVRLGSVDGRAQLVGVSESIRAGGGELLLGALVPASWAIRGVRPVLVGGTLLLVVLMAGAVTAAVAWRRARAVEVAVEREAERWKSLAEHRQREGRWRGLADHSPAPVVCLVGSQVVAANLAAADRLAGGERSQLVGRDFLTFAAESDRDLLHSHLEEQRAGRDARRSVTVGLRTSSGQGFVARVTTASLREFDAGLVYLSWEEVGSGRQAAAVLETLVETIPLAVVLTDVSGNLTWANAAAIERGGEQLHRLKGQPLLSLVERSHHRVALAAMARARRGRTAGGQVRMFGRDGSAVPTEFKAVPVRVENTVTGVLFVISEIGMHPVRPGEFPAAARERALSHLATSLAHRVSNNFQALLGLLDELKEGGGSERTLGLADELVSSSVEDLRRFVAASRSGSGALRPVRLGPLLARWAEKAGPRLPGTVRLTVRREADEDRVNADASQLLLWLDVSLSSALSVMDLGGAVEVALRKGREAGTVALEFSDTAAHGDATGDSGFRRDLLSSRRAAQALGELIAARLGGRTGGSFRPGLVGRSWLELPCIGTKPVSDTATPRAARPGAVLLADDEEMVRIPLAMSLRGAGYDVVEACNGLEAVQEVVGAPERFALVVLDLVMPVMDGREALRRLRAQAPAVPVIICTGYDPSGDEILAAADLLVKPFSIEEFLTKVAELTGRGAGGAGNGDSIRQ